MNCDNKEIPPYLHWNNRTPLKATDYRYFQKLYRLKSSGNPIEIPEAWITSISCKWSKIVRKKDILSHPANEKWNDYDFLYIRELRKYHRTVVLNEQHEFNGTHELTCLITHAPLPCDFSHSEILIRHKIFKLDETKPYFDEVYTYESWENKTALLKKQRHRFFKELKSDFRADMIRLFSRKSSQNTWLNDLLFFFNLTSLITNKD